MQRIKGFLVQVYDEGIRAANNQERRPRLREVRHCEIGATKPLRAALPLSVKSLKVAPCIPTAREIHIGANLKIVCNFPLV